MGKLIDLESREELIPGYRYVTHEVYSLRVHVYRIPLSLINTTMFIFAGIMVVSWPLAMLFSPWLLLLSVPFILSSAWIVLLVTWRGVQMFARAWMRVFRPWNEG